MPHNPDPTSIVPSQIRLYLLGSFRVERDGKPVDISTRKVEALLAYLVLYPQEHLREQLATLFWGDSDRKQSAGSLRTALTTIRKKLGNNLLLADRVVVQKNLDTAIWVDVREFEQATKDNPQFAITLYQGDFLSDFNEDMFQKDPTDLWISRVRFRLRALYHKTILELIQQARSESQYERAVELAKKLLENDPANEQAHQHLMFCYAVTGNRVAALEQYENCKRIFGQELGVEPSIETTALYEKIKANQTSGKGRATSLTNLPIPPSSFVGRQNEIAEVKFLIAQHRLVTLTGSGGCGKTRLAFEVARQLVEKFEHGAWWVDLAPLLDVSLVSQTVAQSLGLWAPTDQVLDEVLVNFLRAKQVLLILDNCEHLISACAEIVDKLLQACAGLKILATSREALRITGEMLWRVPSLSFPEGPIPLSNEHLIQYDAVRLFVERAKLFKPEFTLIKQNADAVIQICRRLDGIPLALELAAARVAVLTPEEIVTHLDDRFNLLTDGSRAALPRQQTLRATIDWSYNLLSEAEGISLRRLCVFAGGWTLEAAKQICGGGSIEPIEMLNLLNELANKSLILVQHENGTTRYRMLETIRQYAAEKLGEAKEVEQVRQQHAQFFSKWLETQPSRLRGPVQVASFRQIETEHDNLRVVLNWARDHGEVEMGLSLAVSLAWFWERYGHISEGCQWLDIALKDAASHPVPDNLRAKALQGLGSLVIRQNDPVRGADLLERSVALMQELGDCLGIANTLIYWGGLSLLICRFEEAAKQFERSGTLFRESGDKWGEASAIAMRGVVKLFKGEIAVSRELLDRSLVGLKEAGEEILIGLVQVGIGYAMFMQDQREGAEVALRDGLRLLIEGGEKPFLVYCIVFTASVLMINKQFERAVGFLGISQMLSDLYSAPLPPLFLQIADKITEEAQSQLDSAVYEAARAKGRAMTLEQAAAYVLKLKIT